jgi:hypothetical protein
MAHEFTNQIHIIDTGGFQLINAPTGTLGLKLDGLGPTNPAGVVIGPFNVPRIGVIQGAVFSTQGILNFNVTITMGLAVLVFPVSVRQAVAQLFGSPAGLAFSIPVGIPVAFSLPVDTSAPPVSGAASIVFSAVDP